MSLVDNTSEPTDNPRERRHLHLDRAAGVLDPDRVLRARSISRRLRLRASRRRTAIVDDWLGREYGESLTSSHDPYYQGLHEPAVDSADAGLLAEVRAGAQVLRDAQLLRWADLADYDNDLEHIAASR